MIDRWKFWFQNHRPTLPSLRALLGWILLAGVGLQLYFGTRIALMGWVDLSSTTFQRSQVWRILHTSIASSDIDWHWKQTWIDAPHQSTAIAKAVIASEDARFFQHHGVEWESISSAWNRNAKQKAKDEAQTEAKRIAQEKAQARAKKKIEATTPTSTNQPSKVVGGSTISQQWAKNIFLSGERTWLRKGQELILTYELEFFLNKSRLLELYLNHVEWGDGVFGIQAAAQHYYRKSAEQLTTQEAARLAVMLPAPRNFEKNPQSTYLNRRTRVIASRMVQVQLPENPK